MNTTHLSTHIAPSQKRFVASALAVALTLASGTVLAAQPASEAVAGHIAPSPQSSQRVDGQDTFPSRINGRSDWDVDYPSQLAPQSLHTSPGTVSAVTGKPAAEVATSSRLSSVANATP
jgi:hypothetical protein